MFGWLWKSQPSVKQTIIVKKTVAKTRKQAAALAKPHAERLYTSRETSQSFRFRQRPPEDFKPKTFKTIQVEPGVSIVIGKLKRRKK